MAMHWLLDGLIVVWPHSVLVLNGDVERGSTCDMVCKMEFYERAMHWDMMQRLRSAAWLGNVVPHKNCLGWSSELCLWMHLHGL